MLQLWHMGRLVHSSFNEGRPGVSASATTGPGHAYTPNGKQPLEQARALKLAEIPRVIEDYAKAAANAKRAGFDGVQVHSANGYLLDQFLRDNSNFGDDDYGGSIENRIRLTTEVSKAVCDVWGAGRVSVRLSPNGESQGCDDSTPQALFTAAAKALSDLGIAFLELREPGPDGTFGNSDVPKQSPAIRAVFKGNLVLNSDLSAAEGQASLDQGHAEADQLWLPIHLNARSGGPLCTRRRLGRLEHPNLVFQRRGRLHRLSGCGVSALSAPVIPLPPRRVGHPV